MVGAMTNAPLPTDMPQADEDGSSGGAAEPGRSRRRRPKGSAQRLGVRFSESERAEVEAVAASVNVSAGRFCADTVLAVIRGESTEVGEAQDREALARLQRELFAARTAVVRFGTNVNQAVAALNSTGEVPEWLERAMVLVTGRCAPWTR